MHQETHCLTLFQRIKKSAFNALNAKPAALAKPATCGHVINANLQHMTEPMTRRNVMLIKDLVSIKILISKEAIHELLQGNVRENRNLNALHDRIVDEIKRIRYQDNQVES